MSLLVYVDRGVISSAAVSGSPRVGAGDPGSGLQGEFGVGYALFGLLQAAFMLGLLIGAPAFSAAAKTWNPFKLIGLGLAGWTLAAAGCATATTYAAFFACRVFVGLGEASFCALAAPFIDDVAPPGRKTLWLATFYLCIPLGVAGGVMFGGAVAGAPPAHALGWRWAFGLEAVAMAPVALFCLASGPVPMRGVDERAARASSAAAARRVATRRRRMTSRRSRRKLCWRTTFRRGSGTRFQERDTRRRTRGQISRDSQSAIHGGLVDQRSRRISRLCAATARFWWPSPGTSRTPGRLACTRRGGPRRDSASTPQTSKRPVARMSCSAGSPSSPASPGRSRAASPPTRRAPTRAHSRVCAVSGFVAFAFLELAFWVDTFAAFAVLFFLGQAFAFGVQAPVNAVVLRSVRASERPLACSLVTVIIHALGDVPTPPLFGLALEASAGGAGGAPTPANWRAVLGGFTALMAVAAATGPRGGGRWRARRAKTRAVSLARVGGISGGACEPRRVFGTRGNDGDDASGALVSTPGATGASSPRRCRFCPAARREAPRSGAARASERDDRRGEDEKENEKKRLEHETTRRAALCEIIRRSKSIPMHREL